MTTIDPHPSKNIFLRGFPLAYLFPLTRPRFDKLTRLLISRDCALWGCLDEMIARGYICAGVRRGPDDHFDMAVRLTFVNYPFSWHQANSQHVIPFIDLPPG